MTAISTSAITAGRQGLMGRLSDLFWRRPNLLLVLMLVPPLLWLGIIYVGSLVALLLQSFFSIDEFSGLIKLRADAREPMASCCKPGKTWTSSCAPLLMSADRHAGLRDHRLPDRLLWRALCAGAAGRPLFYLGIMLPLWASYLVKVYAWKLILAKEGILTWLFAKLRADLGARWAARHPRHRRQFPVDQLSRHLHRLRLCLAALHDPAHPGSA
jgi:putative spermidine/putrescine transport system permease protein